MTIRGLWLALRGLFARRAVERELDDELRFHIEMEAEKLERAGLRPDEARREAYRRFGGVERFKEEARGARGTRWLEDAARDLRIGARSLARTPAFALTTLLTLALGIGGTTAVFSVVNAVLLRPLPFPDSERLVTVWVTNPRQGIDEDITSWPNFADWRAGAKAVERVAVVRQTRLALTGAGDPEELPAGAVSDGFFDLLGAPLALGRGFRPDEVEERFQRVTVLSHELWVRRFGADPGIVGRAIQLGGEPYEVVGVTEPGRRYPLDAQLWIPLSLVGQFAELRETRGTLWLPAIGRVAPGSTLEQAQTEMSAIAARLERDYPANEGMGIALEPLHETLVGDVRAPLLTLLGAVAFVLLVGCANVANLMLVRGATRQREMAVRLSIGAGRARLVRQVVAESALLGLLGAAAGALVAAAAVRAFLATAPAGLPRAAEVTVDPTALAFALALSLLTALAFAVLPALQVGATDPGGHLREGGRGSAEALGRLRPVFVGGQFAVALMLLMGAALLARSFMNLRSVDPGFAPDGVLVAELSLPAQRYGTGADVRAFYDETLAELRALPGADGAELISDLLLTLLPNSSSVAVESRPEANDETPVTYDGATPGFFDLMGIELVAGRAFGSADTGESPSVAVVNETFVRMFLPGLDPVGQRFTFGGVGEDTNWTTIVGVMADARRSGLDREVRPGAIFPFAQNTTRRTQVLVRASGDPAALAGAVRTAVQRNDPDLPLRSLRTLDQLLADSLAQRRFVSALLAVFAALATLLASIGIYGVMAYLVGRRTREIGVRVALGAERAEIVRSVLKQGLLQAGIGMTAGALGSAALAGLLRTQLFAVEPSDPTTFLAVAALLLVVALAASGIPAARAARIDPTVALQAD
jgi:putative ABC transport system permease protein